MIQETTSATPRQAEELHAWIDREQVIERYVQNRLQGIELERFEEHYLTCGTCVERLELAERFQSSLRWVVAEEAERAVRIAGMAWWARQLRRPGVWVFAILLVLLVPSWLGWHLGGENERLEEALSTLRSPAAITAVARLDTLRSEAGEAPAIKVLAPRGREKLLLELVAEADAVYDVRLGDVDTGWLWEGSGLVASNEGHLRLVLGTETLGRGAHTLELFRRSETGEVPKEPLRYTFEVLDAPVSAVDPPSGPQ